MSRLVPVSPAIKAHPLWSGSNEEMSFRFGGVTVEQVERMIAQKSRCADLTANERSWVALWKQQLR